MTRRFGFTWLLVSLATACASKPPCAATPGARGSGNASDTRKVSSRGCAESPAAPAPPPRPMFYAVPIEDPSGHALTSFHNALHNAETKQGQARIAFYGASHVAADIYTEVVRARLQARFGEAGAGFAMPAKPLTHYHLASVGFENSSGWTGVHVKAAGALPDHYGLAGMYVVSGRKPARSTFSTRARPGLAGTADEIELYYWKQPRGGHLRLIIDDEPHEIATASGRAKPAYERFSVPDAEHRIELATRGDGPVQLFGMTLERNQPGVVLDTLGIPGARAANQLLWDEALFREHLTRRHPDLVVLAYGTNESGDDSQPIEEYASSLRLVMARVRDAAPTASCLLIGPSDRPERNEAGSFAPRPRTALIGATQRLVAAEFGCGFFDLVAFMGGPMSMVYWVQQNPAFGAPDYVHFTYRGYEALGNVLHDALLQGYGPTAPMLAPPPSAEPKDPIPLSVESDTPQTP